MAIHVRLEGELPPVWVPVVPSDSAGEALNDSAELWEKDPEDCRLFFGDEELTDPERSLEDYGVDVDAVLVLRAGA